MDIAKIRYAPLSSSFMAVSIIGFLTSIWMVMDWSEKWGFTLTIFFLIMFISSFISMTKAEPIDEHMDELAVHDKHKMTKRTVAKSHLHPIKVHDDHRKMIWEDAAFGLFIALAIVQVAQMIVTSSWDVNPILFFIVLVASIGYAIWMIVEILSTDYNYVEQIVYTVLIVAAGIVGMVIYYAIRRKRYMKRLKEIN